MLNELTPNPATSVANPAAYRAALEALFGPLVPHTQPVQAQLAHQLVQADRVLEVWRLSAGAPAGAHWRLTVVWPRLPGRCPVLLSPDGCWPHVVGHEAASTVLRQGIALAWFDRTELAFDTAPGQGGGGFDGQRHPGRSACLAVWAWGLQCGVDALQAIGPERMASVAVIGHSRGGKAALLAAALDTRIAAVIAHNSGTAGAASLAIQPAGAESLAQLAQQFPHWLGPAMQEAAQRERLVEMDLPRHMLSQIAPRGLCLLQAQDDLWANPAGTRHMADVLRPLWERAAPEPHGASRLQWHARTGGHAMTAADWQTAARFVREVVG
ncbi:hypothetical protein ACHEXK_12710 [Limnohabitans sp. DCL3]|uniref:glucuronyl esterase domain-containing protein n=1 Tax=Limnohabitans sp. DCL3 TaxID=3374103 RepID=UPI003A86CE4E